MLFGFIIEYLSFLGVRALRSTKLRILNVPVRNVEKLSWVCKLVDIFVLYWIWIHCFIVFSPGPRGLSEHLRKEHNVTTKPRIICPHCPTEFSTNYKLKLHILTSHTADEEKPFRCLTCGKGFALKLRLDEHTWGVHTKEKPYVCKWVLSIQFSNSAKLCYYTTPRNI